MSVVIIDYGLSNLGSIFRSFEECGAQVAVSKEPSDLATASHIVLPGVGSFCDGMRNITEQGWVEPLKTEVLQNKIPLLGICLGMQIMAESGTEGGTSPGLGLIPGQVRKLPRQEGERIPHVGWNEIQKRGDHPILNSVSDRANFYFVHSYHFVTDDENIIATTPYAGGFVSIIARDNIIGTQFHPEKSQSEGFQVIRNFLELSPC